jgi:hypothetical protein
MGRAKAVGFVVVVVALSAGLLPSGRPLVPPAAANHGPENSSPGGGRHRHRCSSTSATTSPEVPTGNG